MAPMSLKLVLRGPGVHNACHTTLSLQPCSNGDLFLPKRATTDFNHSRITSNHHQHKKCEMVFHLARSDYHNVGTSIKGITGIQTCKVQSVICRFKNQTLSCTDLLLFLILLNFSPQINYIFTTDKEAC